jgi:CheY-like chemotaxis protein
LGNAIKFTKQGEIVIDVCVVGRHEGKVLTHFEVRDTGMGIPDATLKTLFQPFVQADSSTTRHFGGTGLGLSIVRRLVEMMGGQVGVVSKVGEGSNFFFTLSLEPKEDPITINTQNANRNAHILVVDDNATNRRVLDGLLTHQGYQVTCVDGGAAALESLQGTGNSGHHRKYDLVITDFQMPDMDGVMLGERITKDPSLAHLRLIMLTSLDRQGDSKHLASLGFAAYLTKPVRTRELLDCVTHILSRETRQTEMRPMLTRNSLLQGQPQKKFAGHVLLVEDNLVNQKVAARFLERMGCTVHIAGNGADGVAMYKERQFDAVLMDLQMPVMDGLTATRTIRELETGTSRRVPIIALTANAMRGDKERCEAAGMDGFLTKPIEVERLRDTLAKFGLNADRKTAHTEAIAVSELLEQNVTAAAPPIDLARLNEITGGDPEFAKELIETFISSCEAQIVEIHDAIGAADHRSLARSAHKLKGACANIHAEEMRLLVARLESEALTTNADDLLACNAQLRQAFARAKEFLSDPSVVPTSVRAAS